MQIDVIPPNQSSSFTPRTCAQMHQDHGIFGALTVILDPNRTIYFLFKAPEVRRTTLGF